MFKKLKEKITEEVKISPQRFQQLTQSVSDKLQGNSAPDENMFSIGEDDENASSMSTDQGFSSVTLVSPSSDSRSRRLSNSSMASDVSFLPRYEAGSTYHLQSDLDASASELEDNVSQSSSQLGHISKEQVYSAFKKSQLRYHKYRGRYTDLARHYKELERENAKMKSVLVETQDRAFRRVAELKEQCGLEQKAKAHLEGALRDELDEKQMKIESLQTKINLLHADEKEAANNIDADKLEQLTKYLNDARSEIEMLNSKIQEYKASAIVQKSKIAALEQDIVNFSEREKENNIKLAENKMDLHNELLSKDAEISRLKKDIESFRSNENRSTKMENLQIQNTKLIEKVENLMQKCNGLENELLKVEKYKMDITELTEKNLELNKIIKDSQKNIEDELLKVESYKIEINELNKKNLELNKLIEDSQKDKEDYERKIEDLRASAIKNLNSLENKISQSLSKEYEEREEKLKEDFELKLKEISQNNQSAAELNLQLIDKDNEIKKIVNELQEVQNKLMEKDSRYNELETNHLGLIEDSDKLRKYVNDLKKQVPEIGNSDKKMYEDKIDRLQANIKTLQEELSHLEKISEEKEAQNVQLTKENLDFETRNVKLLEMCKLLEEKLETVEINTTEDNLLTIKLQALEEEKQTILESFEMERKLFNKIQEEHNDLKIKEIKMEELENRNKLLEEKIVELKGFLTDKEATIVEINKLKLALEQALSKTQESLRILEEKQEAQEINKTECNLLQIKVQQLENEKENLIKTFQLEREMFDRSFHTKHEELETHREDIKQENIELAKENLELKKINEELTTKVRIFEERHEVLELESIESNLLKLKLQEFEKEKEELSQTFEAERKMFNKILIEHKELKIANEKISDLESSHNHLTEKILSLKKHLNEKEDKIVQLQRDNLALEQEISKLQESLRLRKEQIDSMNVEKSECGLLEIKLKSLEEENHSLLKSFENERGIFEEALSKANHLQSKVDELNETISILSREKFDLEEEFIAEKEKWVASVESRKKDAENMEIQIGKVNKEKELLEKEIENLKMESQVSQKQIHGLNDTINSLKEEIDSYAVKIENQTDLINQLQEEIKRNEEKHKSISDTLNKEKIEKTQALEKLKQMQQELDKNNNEIIEIKNSLESVDKLYEEAKTQQSGVVSLLEDTKKELEQKIEELQFKTKEMHIIEEKFTNLAQENAELVSKIKELEQLNEALHSDCNKLNQEISELKLRINHLTSDNRNINEEHEKLLSEMEEYKAKCELMENEKGSFDALEQERDSLQKIVTELNEKIEKSSNSDLGQIQQNFSEIKEQCDRLHMENQNLKSEYSKLEEQCQNFSKVKKDLESQMDELERHYNEVLHEKQLLQDEVQELKISPINASVNGSNNCNKLDDLMITKQENSLLSALPTQNGPTSEGYQISQTEIENLKDKVLQYKSIDMTNKSSIEFYENELQKMKIRNEKLNRKLDETLVTLNHCTELSSSSTEIEYLKNVLYNYMLGKEGMVLARVIAAVCKFDPGQTEAVLQKEQQKQTLLGQLGIL
ncbi:unnamed protein product [Ceutorhynchus assimilis]|uniref:GRIP domain-containing protein n=1 Tax=Ceutorhynchus assimilis TaxID=467358 RepID=A0A9N9MQJ8_9CUCU|nr:unnamed protein product [Ceutorhynchus assimilis]